MHRSSNRFNFYLLADDKNLLFAHKDLNNLKFIVNEELLHLCEWLNSNKLSLNTAQCNFVIFHPYQHKLDHNVNLEIFDNNSRQLLALEHKTHVKYLGVLIDGSLSWKQHIDYISMKISKGIGIIVSVYVYRLRHLMPFCTLLNIYCSLVEPYLSYGLVAWGQALNTHLDKIVILQKCALPLMYFADYKSHSVPLFVKSRILPVKLLYFKSVASLSHDIDNQCAPPNISNLFTRSKQIHSYSTRSAIVGNFFVEISRTNQWLFFF